MLIAYPRWNGRKRLVLYFHHTNYKPTYGSEDDDDSQPSNDVDHDFLAISRTREAWCATINATLLLSAGSLASTALHLACQKLLVLVNPVCAGAMAAFKEAVVPVFRDAGVDYEVRKHNLQEVISREVKGTLSSTPQAQVLSTFRFSLYILFDLLAISRARDSHTNFQASQKMYTNPLR